MEKIPLGRRRARDSIHGPLKPAVLFNQKSLEPTANSVGSGFNQLQLQNSLSTVKEGRWEPDALSRRQEYSPEEGARHTEQSILKPEHFQISVIHQKQSTERALTPERREPTSLRIIKLSDKPIVPTKGSRFAAYYDIYAVTDGLVPAKGQRMIEAGIAIGLPQGTYGRLAARSGMASKIGIAVGGGVRDGDYNGEVKVILRNHGEADCVFKARDRIA